MNPEKLRGLVALLRRHLFSALCVGVTLAALATAGLWWLGIEDLRTEHELKSKQDAGIRNLLKTGPVLKIELAAVREFTQRLEANLTDEDERSDNDDYFRRMAARTRARLDDFQQLSSPPLEEGALYKRIPFSVRVVGSYAQALAFLHAVETGPRLANITALNILRFTPNSTDVALEIGLEVVGKK
jgi:Tfp pilus assembly protein PilO